MQEITIENKRVQLFNSKNDSVPLIILNTVMNEGKSVWEETKKLTSRDFNFCSIGNLDLDSDMSPWAIPPISENDKPCNGGADKFLEILITKIIPQIKKNPKYIALCGYSLAGLFAVYSLFKTDIFSRIATASGSFWYPDFVDFVLNNKMKTRPDYIYFSLGDTEKNSKNKILQTVEDNTIKIYEYYKSKNLNTFFEFNKGGHFTSGNKRMAKGIVSVLEYD